MRFASLGGSNVSDYAAAGKAVADSSAKTFAVQRKTGPDYGELSKVAMKTAAEEKMTSMKASANVTKAGISAYEDVVKQGNKIEVFNKKTDIKAKQKMAGGIAAIGKLAGVGILSRERKRDPYPTNSSEKAAALEKYKATRKKNNAEEDAYFDSNTDKPTSGGSTDAGKVTSGGVTTPAAVKPMQGMSDGWAKWSKLIKAGEGTSGANGYNTMFTGTQFTDTSRHPRQINRSGDLSSDAAGAYQFLSTTWDGAKNALNLTDFSPASQEKAGKYLAQQRGLATDTVFTDKQSFLKELDKISPEWASMPTLSTGTSYYGQGGLTPDQAWNIYNS